MTTPQVLDIDLQDNTQVQTWAQKLDVSEQTLREAVAVVGPALADVELHLKGSHSTTNSELTQLAASKGKAEHS
jgi:small-conductance mechanosensitive channel